MFRFILVALAAVFALLAYYGTPELAGGQGSLRAATHPPALRPPAPQPPPAAIRAADAAPMPVIPAVDAGMVGATLPSAMDAAPGVWDTAQESGDRRGVVSASQLSQ